MLLREPHVTERRLGVLCAAAASAGLRVWVHDRHPAARGRPEGLHLSASGSPCADRPFGQSCHSPEALDRAFSVGAAYALLSPVYRPTSKPGDDRVPLGVDRFVDWAAGRSVRALGGITPRRSAELAEAGAAGIAVLGGIFGQPEPESAAKMVTKLLAPWSGGT